MYCTAGKLTSPLVIDVNGGRVAAVVCAHCVVSHLSRDFTLRRFISQMNKQFNKQVSRPVLRFERPVKRIGLLPQDELYVQKNSFTPVQHTSHRISGKKAGPQLRTQHNRLQSSEKRSEEQT